MSGDVIRVRIAERVDVTIQLAVDSSMERESFLVDEQDQQVGVLGGTEVRRGAENRQRNAIHREGQLLNGALRLEVIPVEHDYNHKCVRCFLNVLNCHIDYG